MLVITFEASFSLRITAKKKARELLQSKILGNKPSRIYLTNYSISYSMEILRYCRFFNSYFIQKYHDMKTTAYFLNKSKSVR